MGTMCGDVRCEIDSTQEAMQPIVKRHQDKDAVMDCHGAQGESEGRPGRPCKGRSKKATGDPPSCQFKGLEVIEAFNLTLSELPINPSSYPYLAGRGFNQG